MKDKITFQAMKIGNHRIRIHNQYFILAGSRQIGEIVFKKKIKHSLLDLLQSMKNTEIIIMDTK